MLSGTSRAWILPTAGAVLVATATVLGLIFSEARLLRSEPSGTDHLVVRRRPDDGRIPGTPLRGNEGSFREAAIAIFRFGLFGAVCGLIASVVYGIFGIEETPCEPVSCGWSVLGMSA